MACPRGNVAAPGMTRNFVPTTRRFVMRRKPHLKNPANDPAVQLFTPALIINPISPSCPQLGFGAKPANLQPKQRKKKCE